MGIASKALSPLGILRRVSGILRGRAGGERRKISDIAETLKASGRAVSPGAAEGEILALLPAGSLPRERFEKWGEFGVPVAFTREGRVLCGILEERMDPSLAALLAGWMEKERMRLRLRFRSPSKVAAVERAMEEGRSLVIGTGGRERILHPRMLIYLDGLLSVVGEDSGHRCLAALPLDEIPECRPGDKAPKANFSRTEVEDFVYGMRLIEDSEERLVLKIADPSGVNLRPPHHFLGSPYMTSGSEGDLLWAASVEVNEELIDWLRGMGDSIEVLDPSHVRDRLSPFGRKRPA